MRRLAPLLAAAILFCACDDGASEKEPARPEAAPAGEVSYGGGGGGDVRVAPDPAGQETVDESYEKALDEIKSENYDVARERLLGALKRAEGTPREKDIRDQLRVAESGLYRQPAHEVTDLFLKAPDYYGKNVSVRGLYVSGGQVGQTVYYFWLRTTKRKIQCRYDKLPLEDKKRIFLLKDGAQLLVRGTFNAPWGSNPNPFLELSYIRIEKLAKAEKK